MKKDVIEKAKSSYSTSDTFKPDVWFEPEHVWEVKAADLSISPVHTAATGMAHESRGIALRFPRFLRVRADKKPEEATSAEQVCDMYKSQDILHQ